MTTLPLILAVAAAVLALGFFAAGLRALRRRRVLSSAAEVLVALLLFAVAGFFGVVTVATQGYRALTREELAATVEVQPTGPRRFEAVVTLPDGRQEKFDLAGDQLYVDAHILKWKSVANLLGLHTVYELDRIGGRYTDIASELDEEKTVHSLNREKPLDMFDVARRFPVLEALVDAEYGSGTFKQANRPATWDVFVSTTGLLIRPSTP
jgi:hypothetical protein